ncbi:MAG: hypothetical protein OEW05_00155 [Candidatus Aminicenantes bacterium]|nr:hypothetical protein [Candidatus Aminicenantes bacterium]
MTSRIAGLLLCGFSILAATVGPVGGQANAEVPDVFKDPESLVRGIYAAVSFDPGPAPDWEFVKTFFLPQAVIVVRKTRTSMAVMNVQEFVDWFADDVEKFKMTERGFEETVQKLKLTTLGDIAHAFVVYKARLKTPADAPGQIGLDSWALMRKDGRWWIAAITNDIPTPQRPLPEELR